MASPLTLPPRKVSEVTGEAAKVMRFDGLISLFFFSFLIDPLSSFRVRLGGQLRVRSPQELHREQRLQKSHNQIQVRGQRSDSEMT